VYTITISKWLLLSAPHEISSFLPHFSPVRIPKSQNPMARPIKAQKTWNSSLECFKEKRSENELVPEAVMWSISALITSFYYPLIFFIFSVAHPCRRISPKGESLNLNSSPSSSSISSLFSLSSLDRRRRRFLCLERRTLDWRRVRHRCRFL